MKIYNRADFLKLKEGTIFAKGKPWFFSDLCVKGESLGTAGECNDFIYRNLVNIESEDSGQWGSRLDQMLDDGVSYDINPDYSRDGCFDEEDIFLVYESPDILNFITTLTGAL